MFYKKLCDFIKEDMTKSGLISIIDRFHEIQNKDRSLMNESNYEEYYQYITNEEKEKLKVLNNKIITFILQNRDDIFNMLKLFDKNEKAFITAFINEFTSLNDFMYTVQLYITSLASDKMERSFKMDKNEILPYTVDFYSGGILLLAVLKDYVEETNYSKPFHVYLNENNADIIGTGVLKDYFYKLTQFTIKKHNIDARIYPYGSEYVSNLLIYLFKVWCNFSMSKADYYSTVMKDYKDITYEDLDMTVSFHWSPEIFVLSVPVPLHEFYYESDNKEKSTINWNCLVDKYLVFSKDPSLYIDGIEETYFENGKDSRSLFTDFVLNYGMAPYKFSNAFMYLDNITFNKDNINLYYTIYYNNGIPADAYTDILTGKTDFEKGITLRDKLDLSTNIKIELNTTKNTLACDTSNRIYFSGADKFVNLGKIITPLDLWYGFQTKFNIYKMTSSNLKLSRIYDHIDNLEDTYIVEKTDDKFSIKKIKAPQDMSNKIDNLSH